MVVNFSGSIRANCQGFRGAIEQRPIRNLRE